MSEEATDEAARNVIVEQEVKTLSDVFAAKLKLQIADRSTVMESDDISHRLIYQVLGIGDEEGRLIDIYQNKGRFLYKYAGSFLEDAAFLWFKSRYPQAGFKIKVDNPLGTRPRRFEIDCLVDKRAFEIKWRDATTDGDHITKEHARMKAIQGTGLQPIRIMFYYPNRTQAIRIQETLKTLYGAVGGLYFAGDDSWKFIQAETGIDLLEILRKIARERMQN